jgi:glycosyltransferase involved in cell wall biosynthesis
MRDPWTSRTPTGFVKRLLIQLAMLDRRLSLYVLVPPGASSTSPLPHVEDPVEISADAFDRSEIRRTLALQAESLVAIIGRIDERKNVPLAVEAMRLVVPRVSAQLIVAGVISPGIVDFLDRQRASAPWVHVDNRYLSNAEFDEYIAAADVILAAYENRAGSSGVLSRAAALGTPVVAANIEYGLQLAATGAGIAAEPRAAAVADAIVRALERGRPEVRRDLYSSRRGVDAFAETLLGAPR